MEGLKQVPSCLWELPGLTLQMLTIDTLHCMDLGVSQDILGNLFWEYLALLPGSNQDKRVKALLLEIKEHQRKFNSPTKLQGLSLEMIKRDKEPPKLRTKGGETRSLMSFAVQSALTMQRQLDTVHSLTVLKCISALMDFYMLMSLDEWHPEAASKACQDCCLFYKALEEEAKAKHGGKNVLWRLKPKIHLFQELAQYQAREMGNPRDWWCYKDEDFVGFLASVARSRGGPKSATTTALAVLQQYRALA